MKLHLYQFFSSYNSRVSQLTCELQRATPILEVALGEMGVALACVILSL